MGKFLLTLLLVAIMLLAICFIISRVLAKNPKDFKVKFGLKGFEMSSSFYKDQEA